MAQTIKELQDVVASLTTKLNDKEQALTAAYEQSEGREQQRAVAVEALTREQSAHQATRAKLGQATAERDEAREEAETANSYVHELSEQLSKAEASQAKQGGDRTVTHDGKDYRVTAGRFHFRGQDYAAADLTSGSELLAELVQLKAGVLELVEEEDDATPEA